ncbi:MFS general substrate transporter [Lentithecium fluviatile CBS 122367]|uniref:MFS general substrate transporter n=1 Tax=Lentithecium fluviatile CBS 122367 TaxID=1168545 RepID=A0A6G1IW12_9PLEO|nr:MFS general substrate transporter [Lentithecium fluviatile CBS 122367]
MDREKEKVNVTHASLPDPDAGLSEQEREKLNKALMRKLDWNLVPWVSLLYLISFLDRANIGNAKIYGMEKDLHMTDLQYNIGLTVFFIPYSIIEPLTNVALKRMRPRIFLPLIMVTWAICLTCMGLIHNFAGLCAARFFLGLTEAGLFPGVNYYLSCWYKRKEFGIRAAVFFSAAAFAGSFGGLLAAAIAEMHGIGGKPGWAWIFIIEGLGTLAVGVATYWMVADFPDEATFLEPDERARVLYRLQQDKQASASHEKMKNAHVKQALTDWKTYFYMAIYGGCAGSLYAFSLFLPTIIKELGIVHTPTHANLLSVPSYTAALVMTITVGWYADKSQKRGLCNLVMSSVAIVGFIMMLASNKPGVKYAGTYLVALGIYPTIPNTITWVSNNTEGVFKRGIVLGMVIGWGNLNGIVSSNIYRSQDAPRFILGHSVILGYLAVFLFGGSLATTILLRIENRRRRKGLRNSLVENKSEAEIEILGDRVPDFIYIT